MIDESDSDELDLADCPFDIKSIPKFKGKNNDEMLFCPYEDESDQSWV